jgi:tetratricopeptide (TPR) repeat protein
MIRAIKNISLLLVLSFNAAAQQTKTDQALFAYKDGDLQTAKELILEAEKMNDLDKSDKTWNFKGHIFKQIYKTSGLIPNSENRDIAVEAFMKSSNLNPNGKFHFDNIKALEYLSSTYYNDAIKSAIDVRFSSADDPVTFFEQYRRIKLWLNPDEDITRKELEFLKLLAQGFEVAYSEGESSEILLEKAIDNYKNAIKIDSLDYESNFNLAIVYYNKGAKLISQIDFNTGFIELLDIQKECVSLFKNALPYMKKADEIRPNRIETIKGLMFINRALNDFDKYLELKVKLDQLLK